MTNEKVLINTKEKPFTVDGVTKTLTEWAEEFNVTVGWIYILKSKGMLEEKIRTGTLGEKKVPDLTGQIINGIEVLEQVDNNKRGYKRYRVRHIESGREAVVRGIDINSGYFKGKFLSEKIQIPDTRLGNIYRSYFKKNDEFESWDDFEQWAIEKGYTDEYYTKRIDKSKGYTKDNVYFAEMAQKFTAGDKTLSINEWAQELGISRQRVHQLVQQGRLETYVLRDKSVSTNTGAFRLKNPTEMDLLLKEARGERTIKEYCEIIQINASTLYGIGSGKRQITEEQIAIIVETSASPEVTIEKLRLAAEKLNN